MKQQPNPRSAATIERAVFEPATLAHRIVRNAKPPASWQVGLEYEVIGYSRDGLQRIDARSVAAVLHDFAADGGSTVREDDHAIAVTLPFGSVTIEPGGQIEFSGAPGARIDDTAFALRRFLDRLHTFAEERGLLFDAFGFDPLRRLDEQHWVEKQRYAIMRPYLRTRGGHAWNMMVRTAAIQVSIDYGDAADLGAKYVLGNRAAPFVAAMFANSPFADGKLTGLKSTRYATWLDTDPDRTGAGAGALDGVFDLNRYVEAVLQTPLFFVERDGRLRNVAGKRLQDLDDARASDFDHLLSMIFSEARIRTYVEMRSADSCGPALALALMAFWKGLTYDAATLQHALEAVPVIEQSIYRGLQMAVARDALAAEYEGVQVLDVAQRLVRLGREGLALIAPEELRFLDPLVQNVCEDGVCPADLLLARKISTAQAFIEAARVA
ncbi:MAG: glutamate-cysteine ligase family protein [Candidatus Eremiobacteraeota bacterium]|nr:glutamate-cysteine ligase family protein [Candidatus Eremiobacteraeota bacterium]